MCDKFKCARGISKLCLFMSFLWRKSLNKYISIVTYDCDRIVGIKFELNSFAALFVCVYLPYDCSDNFDDYMFLLAR